MSNMKEKDRVNYKLYTFPKSPKEVKSTDEVEEKDGHGHTRKQRKVLFNRIPKNK